MADFLLVLVLLVGSSELFAEERKVALHCIHELALLFDFDVEGAEMVKLHEFLFKLSLVLQRYR